jgi:hypothetical protein
MKKFFITLVTITIFFVLGCQENPVTEPLKSFNKRGNESVEETINLCCALADPAGGNCQLNGQVRSVHQILQNSTEEDGLYLVSLSLNMNSELCRLDGPATTRWKIEGQSQDEFYVSEEGIYILDKIYEIENRMDIVLVVQYLVTTEGIGIPNLWLQEID